MRVARIWIGVALALCAGGFALSQYLLLRTLTLLAGRPPGGADLCSTVFGRGCDATLVTDTALPFGLPYAGWGVVFYAAVAVLVLLAWHLEPALDRVLAVAGLALGGVGALASLGLLLTFVAGAVPLCPLCVVVHAVTFALLFVLWRMGRGRVREGVAGLGGWLRARMRSEEEAPSVATLAPLGLACMALVVIVLFQWSRGLVSEAAARRDAFDPQQTLVAYMEAPAADVPVGPDDARLGPADAPVRLVVFTSFECPYCKRFAEETRTLPDRYAGQLQIVYKHFPLSSVCNPGIDREMYPGACPAALATAAAGRQGAFWELHDAALELTERPDDDDWRALVEQTGLDVARWEADVRSEDVAEAVRADIELGLRLQVDGTPAVFLQGRRVPDLRPVALEYLIGQAIDAQNR